MYVKLEARIKKTMAAIAAATDPATLRSLNATLAILNAAKAEMDGDDDGDEGGDDGGDDKSASEKHAKRAAKMHAKAKATELRAKAAEMKGKAAEAEEEAKRCEEEAASGEDDDDEEEEEAEAAARIAAIGAGAVDPTVVALAAQVRTLATQRATDRAQAEATERVALTNRLGKYLPKHIVKTIAGANLATLRATVTEAEKGSPMVVTEAGDLLVPKHVQPNTEAALPTSVIEMIDDAVKNCGAANPKEFREALVAAHIKAHASTMPTLNGAGR